MGGISYVFSIACIYKKVVGLHIEDEEDIGPRWRFVHTSYHRAAEIDQHSIVAHHQSINRKRWGFLCNAKIITPKQPKR
jgi:hypothetical protein